MEKELSNKFFSNNKKPVEQQVANVNDVSRISAGTIIKGEVSSDCDIRVDGKVEGKIYSKGKVVVGETASIKGSVACNTVDLWGKLEGDLFVRDVLTLKSSADVNGNVNVRKFQVEMGAKVNGTCHMISEAEFDKLIEGVVTTPIPEPAKPAPVKK